MGLKDADEMDVIVDGAFGKEIKGQPRRYFPLGKTFSSHDV